MPKGTATTMPNTSKDQISFTIDQIAEATGAPRENVQEFWPLILKTLRDENIHSINAEIAVIATIATEVSCFQPIHEYGGSTYFTKMYEGRADLGNIHSGDGARYHGRGFIQLTGRANYKTYGNLLGIPLEDEPDIALKPEEAAKILVLYFKRRGIPGQADQEQWQAVRRSVNGGLNGWDRFIQVVERLQAIIKEQAK
jgi:hypothetical protein